MDTSDSPETFYLYKIEKIKLTRHLEIMKSLLEESPELL